MAESRAILYAARVSSCSWRVRAALNLKRIPFEEREVEIVKEKTQLTDEYKRINPAQKVPALVIDGATLIESMAIVQYLEDTRPEPRLTPRDPLLKARMREICEVIVTGIQPLQNIGIQSNFTDEQQFSKFCIHYCEKGLQILEELLQRSAGQYCVGDEISIADLCLVPQVFNFINRFKLDIDKYPTIKRLYEKVKDEKAFLDSHPKNVQHKK